jgi:hypothetical protein
VFDLLIGARAVQFASSILAAGAAVFFVFVAAPALNPPDALLARKQRQLSGCSCSRPSWVKPPWSMR